MQNMNAVVPLSGKGGERGWRLEKEVIGTNGVELFGHAPGDKIAEKLIRIGGYQGA